jgi:hypothetical protein
VIWKPPPLSTPGFSRGGGRCPHGGPKGYPHQSFRWSSRRFFESWRHDRNIDQPRTDEHVIVSWRRRRIASGKLRVESWHFIALAVAAIAIGAATYGVGWRGSRPPGEAKSRPSPLIENGSVQRDSRYFLALVGTYARSGKIARFYVSIQTDPGGNIQTAEFSKPTLVKVLEIKDFEKGEPVYVAVASLRQEDSPQGPFRLGSSDSGLPSEAGFSTTSLVKATVIVKDDSDAEQTFGFVLIPRTTTMELMRANRNNLDRRAEDRQPVPVLTGDNLKLMTETDGDR